MPRWVIGRTWGNNSDSLTIENRISERDVESLRDRGHAVEVVQSWDGAMGQEQGIVIVENAGFRRGRRNLGETVRRSGGTDGSELLQLFLVNNLLFGCEADNIRLIEIVT